MMYILAIETSCDETACAIADSTNIISEVVYSQKEHANFGGVVPEIASRDHQLRLPKLVESLLAESQISKKDIVEVAYTHGPGLAGCLLVGHYYALGLSTALSVPIRGINHLEGHIMSVLINSQQLNWSIKALSSYPAIALIISGGHTLFVEVNNNQYNIIGETKDDAVGEVFDKVGRLMGLDYPAGAALSAIASSGEAIYDLPKPMINTKDASMSFSGLKTASRLLYEKLTNSDIANFAASFEQAIITTLISKIDYVMQNYGHKNFILCGGVSANEPLREAVKVYCDLNNISLFLPNKKYCGDNASMIAVAAWVRRMQNDKPLEPKVRLKASL